MKKMILTIAALAIVSFCGSTYAKGLKTNVDVKISGNTTIVDVGTAGSAITWSEMDVEKNKTLSFINNSDTVVNTVTSKKATSLDGTIESHTGTTADFGGNVVIINAYGFNISNSFTFKGDSFKTATSDEDKNYFKVETGADKAFKLASGSIKMAKDGAVSGNAAFGTETANTDDSITFVSEKNVTLGNVNYVDAKNFSVTGKDVKVGTVNLNNAAAGFVVTASNNATTGAITSNVSTADAAKITAEKNVTIGNVTLGDSAQFAVTATAGTLKAGNLDASTGTNYKVVNYTGATVKTGTINGYCSQITLNATNSTLTTGNVTLNGGSNAESFTGVKGVSMGNINLTTKYGNGITIGSTKGTVKVGTVDMSNAVLKVNAGTTLTASNVTSKNSNDNATFTAGKTLTVKDITNAGTMKLDGDTTINAAKITNNNDLTIEATKTLTAKEIVNNANANLNIDSENATASIQKFTDNANATVTAKAFTVTSAFVTGNGATTNISTDKITLSGVNSLGTVNVDNIAKDDALATISFKKGSFFHELNVGNLNPVTDSKAAKVITRRNFNDSNSWTAND